MFCIDVPILIPGTALSAWKMLDLLGEKKSETALSLISRLSSLLLGRIDDMNDKQVLELLGMTYPYIGFAELRPVVVKILEKCPKIPHPLLLSLQEQIPLLHLKVPVQVMQQLWKVNDKALIEALAPLIRSYLFQSASIWAVRSSQHLLQQRKDENTAKLLRLSSYNVTESSKHEAPSLFPSHDLSSDHGLDSEIRSSLLSLSSFVVISNPSEETLKLIQSELASLGPHIPSFIHIPSLNTSDPSLSSKSLHTPSLNGNSKDGKDDSKSILAQIITPTLVNQMSSSTSTSSTQSLLTSVPLPPQYDSFSAFSSRSFNLPLQLMTDYLGDSIPLYSTTVRYLRRLIMEVQAYQSKQEQQSPSNYFGKRIDSITSEFEKNFPLLSSLGILPFFTVFADYDPNPQAQNTSTASSTLSSTSPPPPGESISETNAKMSSSSTSKSTSQRIPVGLDPVISSFLANLRFDLLMAQHDRSHTTLCENDELYRFAWCLDAIRLDRNVEQRHYDELESIFTKLGSQLEPISKVSKANKIPSSESTVISGEDGTQKKKRLKKGLDDDDEDFTVSTPTPTVAPLVVVTSGTKLVIGKSLLKSATTPVGPSKVQSSSLLPSKPPRRAASKKAMIAMDADKLMDDDYEGKDEDGGQKEEKKSRPQRSTGARSTIKQAIDDLYDDDELDQNRKMSMQESQEERKKKPVARKVAKTKDDSTPQKEQKQAKASAKRSGGAGEGEQAKKEKKAKKSGSQLSNEPQGNEWVFFDDDDVDSDGDIDGDDYFSDNDDGGRTRKRKRRTSLSKRKKSEEDDSDDDYTLNEDDATRNDETDDEVVMDEYDDTNEKVPISRKSRSSRTSIAAPEVKAIDQGASMDIDDNLEGDEPIEEDLVEEDENYSAEEDLDDVLDDDEMVTGKKKKSTVKRKPTSKKKTSSVVGSSKSEGSKSSGSTSSLSSSNLFKSSSKPSSSASPSNQTLSGLTGTANLVSQSSLASTGVVSITAATKPSLIKLKKGKTHEDELSSPSQGILTRTSSTTPNPSHSSVSSTSFEPIMNLLAEFGWILSCGSLQMTILSVIFGKLKDLSLKVSKLPLSENHTDPYQDIETIKKLISGDRTLCRLLTLVELTFANFNILLADGLDNPLIVSRLTHQINQSKIIKHLLADSVASIVSKRAKQKIPPPTSSLDGNESSIVEIDRTLHVLSFLVIAMAYMERRSTRMHLIDSIRSSGDLEAIEAEDSRISHISSTKSQLWQMASGDVTPNVVSMIEFALKSKDVNDLSKLDQEFDGSDNNFTSNVNQLSTSGSSNESLQSQSIPFKHPSIPIHIALFWSLVQAGSSNAHVASSFSRWITEKVHFSSPSIPSLWQSSPINLSIPPSSSSSFNCIKYYPTFIQEVLFGFSKSLSSGVLALRPFMVDSILLGLPSSSSMSFYEDSTSSSSLVSRRATSPFQTLQLLSYLHISLSHGSISSSDASILLQTITSDHESNGQLNLIFTSLPSLEAFVKSILRGISSLIDRSAM